MKDDALYGRFFTFWPRVKRFVLDTVYPENAVCRSCGKISEGGVLCKECQERLRNDGFTMAWDREELDPGLPVYILRPHTGVARQMVLRLKHSAEKCVAEELANLLQPVPEYVAFSPETVVTWVPMPKGRRQERCIDHGQVLAEATAGRLGLQCKPLLIRLETKDKAQATLGRDAREANLQHAFRPAVKEIRHPVLLVDDVLTTGTTARRCADALREAGASEITVLAFTRALPGGSGD